MIQMSVSGLSIDPRSSQPIVVLSDDERVRGLPIWIGVPEAFAISRMLEKKVSTRPTSHGLFLSTVKELGYLIDQVEIDQLDADTYRATIKLQPQINNLLDAETKYVDARPSDAIVIALAADAPIFVSEQLPFVLDTEVEDQAQFRQFVRGLKASDFNAQGIQVKLPDEDPDT